MFAVTTVLPGRAEPISKAKLVEELKTPKTAAELEAIKTQKAAEEKAATDAG